MITIIADHISPRLEYVVKQIFGQFLHVPHTIIDINTQEVVVANGYTIAYTNKTITADLVIQPSGLLSKSVVEKLSPSYEFANDKHKLFVNSTNHFGFDLFSAVFWLITRYEEYLPFQTDQHGRFSAEQSFASQKGFLTVPVIDQWLMDLQSLIQTKCPGLIPERKYTIKNTIDVDNAFAYKGKGFVRQTGAFVKHLMKGQFSKIRDRSKVLSGKFHDPYDTYEYIRERTNSLNIQTIFFHLCGHLGEYDRNISINSSNYKNLLDELKKWAKNGIHPSYASNADPQSLLNEIDNLSKQVGESVQKSRQHFLKLNFPETYVNLIKTGIKEDYTMGFADHVGFRAGTSLSFHFYHLQEEKMYDLLIVPFCVMDGTLRDYMKLNADQATEVIQGLQKQLKQLGGQYIAVWHNETLGEVNGWQGWRKVYESQFK